MKRQKEMESAMLKTHTGFMAGLEESLSILDQEINETGEMDSACTDEWCQATEHYLDDLHKYIYSISEPRWLSNEDSERIRALRNRVKDLYVKYRQVKSTD